VNACHERSRGRHVRLTRERAISQTLPAQPMTDVSHNPNRSLVHIFCVSLAGLLLLSLKGAGLRQAAGAGRA